jgi:hypothetical protein
LYAASKFASVLSSRDAFLEICRFYLEAVPVSKRNSFTSQNPDMISTGNVAMFRFVNEVFARRFLYYLYGIFVSSV